MLSWCSDLCLCMYLFVYFLFLLNNSAQNFYLKYSWLGLNMRGRQALWAHLLAFFTIASHRSLISAFFLLLLQPASSCRCHCCYMVFLNLANPWVFQECHLNVQSYMIWHQHLSAKTATRSAVLHLIFTLLQKRLGEWLIILAKKGRL